MAIKGVNHTLITGLSPSGTTDNLGSWNLAVDLSEFGIPAGATGVFILTENTITSDRWCGLRDNGKTNPVFLSDIRARYARFNFVSVTNNLVDIYVEGNINFYLVGYTDSGFVPFDIDAGFPSQPHVSGTNTLDTLISTVPLTATAVVAGFGSSWAPVERGAAHNPSYALGSHAVVAVNASNQFYSRDGSNTDIIGYDTDPFVGLSGVSPTTLVADSTWRAAGISYPDASMIFGRTNSASAASQIEIRAAGSSWSPGSESGSAKLGGSGFIATAVDGSGNFEYFIETGETSPDLEIFGYSVGSTTPTPTPTLRKGSQFTVTTILSGTVTAATLNGNAITVDSQIGTTVTLTDSGSGIITSGQYDLVLTDDSVDPDETIAVQVNVYGVAPSNNPLQKDGSALASLTGVQVRVTDGANINGTQLYYSGTATTDASGNLGNVDLSSTAAAVDDSVLLHMRTAAGDSIIASETVGLI